MVIHIRQATVADRASIARCIHALQIFECSIEENRLAADSVTDRYVDQQGYRFYFYSADLDEPIHVHVQKSGKRAKFWLQPIKVATDGGFRRHELNEIERIIKRRSGDIITRWEEERNKRNDSQG
jgi:hypothetical protein